MDKIYLGKIVSTHGIKGELKIISDFPYKEKAFIVGNTLWIEKKEYQIRTYRHHKIYEMVTLNDFHNINEVEYLLKKKVYIKREDLSLGEEEVLEEELLTYCVILDQEVGKITEIFLASKTNKILRIEIHNKEILIPWNSPNIIKIDKKNKKLYIKVIDGMIE